MSLAEQHDDHDDSAMGSLESIDGKFIEVPARMLKLRRNGKNAPIPHCSEPTDGKPRLDPNLVVDCLLTKRCWVCYTKLGAHKAFLTEPYTGITRRSFLPPAHLECALFLANVAHPDVVTMIYVTRKFDVTTSSVFSMGEPDDMFFRFKSREATAEEIAGNIESVFPQMIEAVGDNEKAKEAIIEMHDELMEMIPGMQRVKPRKVKIVEGAS